MGKDQDLLEAARIGNIAVVGKILEQITKRSSGPFSSFRRSPCINSQDVNGYTPLHHACLNGHSNIVRLLLSHGAAWDTPDVRGSTPLYLAAWAGHDEIAKQLLMHSPKPANPNAQTIDNETPLHCAAQHGHNTVLAILLAYGADPTIRNNSFQTALDLAAQFGRLQAVQILIRTHPELLAPYRTPKGTPPVQDISSSPYTISPTTHIFTHTCLHLASRNGHKRVVEALLAAGVDVNIMTHAGTALHEAALCGKKAVVNVLLQAGIDAHATDGNGRTALDLLKDYPPHVTYEIFSAIKDFYKDASNGTHFKPINEASDVDEHERSDSSTSPVPKTIYGRSHTEAKVSVNNKSTKEFQMPKTIKLNTFSMSMSSLEQTSTKAPEHHYLKMKPILWQKSHTDLPPQQTEQLGNRHKKPLPPPHLTIFPSKFGTGDRSNLIKSQPNKINQLPHKSYEQIYLARTGSVGDVRLGGSTKRAAQTAPTAPTAHQRCVDEYVKMTEPSFTRSSLNIAPKKPLPSPRTLKTSDYANINHILTSKSNINHTDATASKPTSPTATDANNNNNNDNLKQQTHSPTPDFPPPSVLEAESTILEFMRPQDEQSKRRSIRLQQHNHGDLESFILEAINQLDAPNSPLSSRVSDCVEEFVGDVPFAGLFKGSTLNLATDAKDEPDTLIKESSGLRSPSLVRSVKSLSMKRDALQQKQFNDTEEQNALKVWAEIDTILENIGNEVSNVEKTNKIVENNAESQTVAATSAADFHIRNPADLFLGNQKSCETNWCHSPNALIYGQIQYTVYYLGSTIIRELHGIASTRKSIQRFKRNVTPLPAVRLREAKLLNECNSLTKILKAHNTETRLKVGISLSSTGVKFIDTESQSTICIHDIENINCVCQDAEDLRYFAYITKEKETHYCHVFMADNLDLSREIILTLGEAFEVAYQLALNKHNTLQKSNNSKTFEDSVNI